MRSTLRYAVQLLTPAFAVVTELTTITVTGLADRDDVLKLLPRRAECDACACVVGEDGRGTFDQALCLGHCTWQTDMVRRVCNARGR